MQEGKQTATDLLPLGGLDTTAPRAIQNATPITEKITPIAQKIAPITTRRFCCKDDHSTSG